MVKVKFANGSAQFQEGAKRYVINMKSPNHTLHIKNGCRYAGVFYEYYDFDSLEEAENSRIPFHKCSFCFSNKLQANF